MQCFLLANTPIKGEIMGCLLIKTRTGEVDTFFSQSVLWHIDITQWSFLHFSLCFHEKKYDLKTSLL